MVRKFCFVAGFALLASIPLASRADITVAVASNFRAPAEAIAEAFQDDTGTSVRLVLGSSGKHVASILNGAPMDVFLSADTARPDALEAAGLVSQRRTYAIGRLALFAPDAQDGAAALDLLKSGDFRRLAIADSRLAPYGAAAMQALTGLGLYDALKDKLVIGENIGQTFGFVATGNAELGFVALSQVLTLPQAERRGAYLVPADQHDPIRQDAVLLTRSAEMREVAAFWDFLFSDFARQTISSSGYEVSNS